MNGLGRRPDGENWDEPEGVGSGRSVGTGEEQRIEGGGCGKPGGVSYRQAKRLWKRYGEEGAKGLRHRGAGRARARAKPVKFRRRVMKLVGEK